MTAIVLFTLCFGTQCEDHRMTARFVPRLYCEMGLWQIDLAQRYGDQNYRIERVTCEVSHG